MGEISCLCIKQSQAEHIHTGANTEPSAKASLQHSEFKFCFSWGKCLYVAEEENIIKTT